MTKQPFKIVENYEKKMPCNIEAEQAVIGSILISNDIYDEISPIIDAQKFFDPIHIKIFTTIEMLITKGLLANPITLKNYFENNEGLKELGGHDYLIKITNIDVSEKIYAHCYSSQLWFDNKLNELNISWPAATPAMAPIGHRIA